MVFFLLRCTIFPEMHFDCMHFAITAMCTAFFPPSTVCYASTIATKWQEGFTATDQPKYCNIQIMMRFAKLIKILSPPVVARIQSLPIKNGKKNWLNNIAMNLDERRWENGMAFQVCWLHHSMMLRHFYERKKRRENFSHTIHHQMLCMANNNRKFLWTLLWNISRHPHIVK